MKLRLIAPLLLASLIPAMAEKKPNIVYIIADDLGYTELGCYGQKIIQTPHIDKLAAEGIKFTDHYSGNAVCAPARCVLLTGKHGGHAYIRDNGDPKDGSTAQFPFPGQSPIPAEEITIPELLKPQGYATGAMGKWGLGHVGTTGDPNKQGFDLFFGFICQRHAHNHYPKYLWRNGEMIPQKGNTRELNGETHSQDEFIREALGFIRDNKDQPFFLYLPAAIPHLSIQTSDKWLDQYKGKIPEADYVHKGYLPHPFPRAAYAGMVSQMDDGVGQVMALLKELKLDDNTLVIFTSDNGPTYDRLGGSDSDFFKSSGAFKGLKGSLYEGGIRVPLIARWPGKIAPGTQSDLPSAFYDVMPTFCDVAGTTAPPEADGISFLPTLLGKTAEQKKHDYLYWEFSSYGGQQAIRMGDWKAIRQNLAKGTIKTELYNLKDDPGEANDRAGEKPDLLKKAEVIFKKAHVPSKKFPLQSIDFEVKKRKPKDAA
jgi:arylsulfatase A